MPRIPVLLLGLIAVAFAAAGCGGGGKSTTTTQPATTAATHAATTSAKPSGISSLATAANCKELNDLGTKFSSAMSGATGTQNLKQEAQLLEEFAAKTPAEIRPDFTVLAGAFTKIADALGNVKQGSTPDAATLAKLMKLSTELDTAKLTKASEHITSWLRANCG